MDHSIASLNRSTFEDRQKNISYLRSLYFLFALTLLFSVFWVFVSRVWMPEIGQWILDHWVIALIVGIVAALLLLFAFFSSASRTPPINLIVYLLFTLCFAYLWSYFVGKDPSGKVFYVLCLLTAIGLGFAFYAWMTSSYLTSMTAVMVVVGAAMLVFFLFLVFSKIPFMWLVLLLVPVLIFGFYLNSDVRRMVRTNMFDHIAEDATSGAVRIWVETVFVFCRFIELVGNMFAKNAH